MYNKSLSLVFVSLLIQYLSIEEPFQLPFISLVPFNPLGGVYCMEK
jgi:hypothetical protein